MSKKTQPKSYAMRQKQVGLIAQAKKEAHDAGMLASDSVLVRAAVESFAAMTPAKRAQFIRADLKACAEGMV